MPATPFAAILDAARTGHGAAAAAPDARYLSEMSRRIFRAGLKYSLVDAKWSAFEEVFHGFEPRRVRAMSDEEMEALLGDARLIRRWGKLRCQLIRKGFWKKSPISLALLGQIH